MQIKLSNGQIADITPEEAKRIHHALESEKKHNAEQDHATNEHERNAMYHENAWHSIKKVAEMLGVSKIEPKESDMKSLMSVLLDNADIRPCVKSELLWEMIEFAISCHWSKIHNAD